jgi:hypothetical protein
MEPLRIYRAVLRVHRSLPLEMRQLGDVYLKQEFRSAKSLTDEATINEFLVTWNDYCTLLQQQFKGKVEGHRLNSEALSGEQRMQLNALKEEINRSYRQ